MMLETFDVDFDVQLADASAVVAAAWAEGWTIPARMTVSQWADKYRQIAQGAGAEPGEWRTSRTPYLREIMDALSEHTRVTDVTFKKSAQIGATEVGINWVGYVIDRGLDSMIVAQPVKDLARSWSVSKFEPAVAIMPTLQAKLESDNTFEKQFPGGTLWTIWVNSSKQLRQRTARFVFHDEYDESPTDIGGQGSAAEQLAARAMSYGDRAKRYRACTPTVAGASQIDDDFQDGDRRHYRVRCPECGAHQVLKPDNLHPQGFFACIAHGCEIREHHREAMLRERSACPDCGEVPLRVIHAQEGKGRLVFADVCCRTVIDPPAPDGAFWEPTNPEAPRSHQSYHIWAAYSPEGIGDSWKAIADKRAAAEKNPDKLAGFTNLVLGEVYEGERKTQNAEDVKSLAEPGVHAGVVPEAGLILTAGVDLAHDRFEVQLVAWGRGQRGRVVEYAILDGDPSKPDGYAELDRYLQGVWHNVYGRPMHIRAVAIDGGNWTEMAAKFVQSKVASSGRDRMIQVDRGYRTQALYLIRGRAEHKSERAVYRPSKTEVNDRDKTLARSVGVWGVGTSVLKHIIYGWLSSAILAKEAADKDGEPDPIDARMIRFPGGRGEEYDPLKPDPGALEPKYFEGLVVEYFDEAAKKWIRPKGSYNEPLDTLVYALWAAYAPAVKIDAMREAQFKALEAALLPDPQDLFSQPADDSRETSTPAKPASAPPRATPKRGGVVDGEWNIG
ncbi:terminase gpA endonuclease subunit [Marilutibacter aestuarii]|uniref:Phage terminase large subunit family protein n=1 Tax=Marilutibacter aestuarii TaxID=1706195 RepID=A0A508AP41_9GAMM|nr:terminase gpA endonuclease subunit [Lysobacter aestuarii]TQD51227.1 phage terminase large subunit family protein [Lysobacter aestuarii]